MFRFLKKTFIHFFKSNTFPKGASLAYYAVFSLLPMMIIVTSLLGIFYGKQAVSGEIHEQLKAILGDDASMQIQNIIKNQHTQHHGIITTGIGFVVLLFGASGMFNQIHNAFNNIWKIKAKPKNSIIHYLAQHMASFSVLLLLFFVILASTTLNSFLIKFADTLHPDYKFLLAYEHLTSFGLFIFIFTLMFKFLGNARIHWKAAFFGGVFTSLFFVIGKTAIGLYIGHSHIASTFGSASVLAFLMLWVYYTSQIIFLGASFVKVVSAELGIDIRPTAHAVQIEEVEVY